MTTITKVSSTWFYSRGATCGDRAEIHGAERNALTGRWQSAKYSRHYLYSRGGIVATFDVELGAPISVYDWNQIAEVR